MNVPGLRITVPATPQDTWWQLRQAIASDEPVIVLEHELLYFDKGEVDLTATPPPMHQAIVSRTGTDLTLLSYSRMANLAVQAAEKLAEENITGRGHRSAQSEPDRLGYLCRLAAQNTPPAGG